MNNSGFITLSRQILSWEWYKNINTKVLFLHLLLKANYKDLSFEGHKILRGQLVTSLPSLSVETGLTIKQVRGSLEHLISTGEVTSSSYPRYRIITIVKYNEYQDDDRLNGSQRADERAVKGQDNGSQAAGSGQAEGRQRAASKQYNNNNKETKEQGNNKRENAQPRVSKKRIQENFDRFWAIYPKRVSKKAALEAFEKLNPDDELMQTILKAVNAWLNTNDWQKEGGRFVPNPTTWLKGHRWEDEIPEPVRERQPIAKPAPVKTVTAQQYQQRDYSDIDRQFHEENDRLMAEFLARERGEA